MGRGKFDGCIRWKRAFHPEETACQGEEEARPAVLELRECSLHPGGPPRAFKSEKGDGSGGPAGTTSRVFTAAFSHPARGRRGVGLPKCRGDILMCYPHPQTHNILLQKQKAECRQPHSERGTPRGSVPGTPGGSVPSGLGVVRTPFPLPVTLFHAHFCRHPSWRTAAVLLLACPPCRAQGCLLVNIYCPNLCTPYPAVDAQYQL